MKGVLVPVAPSERARSSYRSLQCTSCHALGDGYGLRYRLFAGPDMVLFHALADALAGGSAPTSRRACVVAPGITRLTVHATTPRTDLAVAFGIWMGVEKLRDDVADEGGWLRALVARVFAPGHARARQTLLDAGFPVADIEAGLARQRSVEDDVSRDLDVAIEPTRTIAGLAFGALGHDDVTRVLARDIGQRVGAILFWIDNALDLPADLRAGRYNALARAWDLGRDTPMAELLTARERAVTEARAQLAGVAPLVVMLPGRTAGELVHSTLVFGLRTQIDALARLDAARWPSACTSDLQPRKERMGQVFARAVPRMRARAGRVFDRGLWRLTYTPRLAVSLLGMALFPRSAWPQQWWPEEPPAVDTAIPPLDDTGLVDPLPSDAGDRSGGLSDWICNPCFASCGYADCDPGRGCENACDAVCSDACDGICDIQCDPDCDCT